MSYDQIATLIDEENPGFEAFFADMCNRIPALKGRGAIEIGPAGFKRALKAAYIAGDRDAITRLINTGEE